MTLHLWWATNLKQYLAVHSYMAFTVCCRCIYGVQGAPIKTDCQVINKKCSRDVPGNTRGQFINLQSKTCHSQDTTCWDTFLWVDLTIECGPNCDSNSVVRYSKNSMGSLLLKLVLLCLTYRIDQLSHRPSLNQNRDLLHAASVQRHPGDTFPDSLCGPSCHVF